MLGDKDAAANLAVKNLAAAAAFYEGKLGLTRIGHQGDQLVVYRSGSSRLNVYVSAQAGTNRATAVTWDVGAGLADLVAALKAKGVAFEHYDMPGGHWEGEVFVGDEGMRVAWFKDPDGNILNLASG